MVNVVNIALGPNVRITVSNEQRNEVARFFGDILRVRETKHPMPDLAVHVLDDGANVGVFFVDPAGALDEASAFKAPWIELKVASVPDACARLEAGGYAKVDYADRAHSYYRMPGGFVFRLAPL